MKKLLTVVLVLVLCYPVFSQTRQYYQIPDYSGGLFVDGDSISQNPNQLVTATNLTYDNIGSLSKRSGIKYWNSAAFPSGELVQYYCYYPKKNGLNKLLTATQNYIYESPFSDSIATSAAWRHTRIGYSVGKVKVGDMLDTVTGIGTYWLTAIKVGDAFKLVKESDSTIYYITKIITDSTVLINDTITLKKDSASYKIYRTLVGDPTMTLWNDNVYITDSKSPSFIYDGSNVSWLSFVHRGDITIPVTNYVDTTINSDSVVFQIQHDVLGPGWHTDQYAKVFMNDTIALWRLRYFFERNVPIMLHRGYVAFGNPDSVFVDEQVDSILPINPYPYRSANIVLKTTNRIVGNQHREWRSYVGSFSSTNFDTGAIIDTLLSWFTDDYVGFYIVSGKRPNIVYNILSNGANTATITHPDTIYSDSIDDFFTDKDRYYVFNSMPYIDTSTINNRKSMLSPIFKQIVFNKNIMYAFGNDFDDSGNTTNEGFVFHSDIGLPRIYRKGYFGFDVSNDNRKKITSLFNMRDDLMISTSGDIYRLSGLPPLLGDGGTLTNMSPEFGLSSVKAVVVRHDNYCYIQRNDGIFRFDGLNIENISLGKVNKLVKQYISANFVSASLGDNVYFSFPDSHYTLNYYEPTKSFTMLDFGIQASTSQLNNMDSSFILFSNHIVKGTTARTFKYPTSLIIDSLTPSSGGNIPIEYKTGWLDLGDPFHEKQFEYFNIPIQKTSGTLAIQFKTDFDTTTRANISIVGSGVSSKNNWVWNNIKFQKTIRGRFFQININETSGYKYILGRWGIRWYPFTEQ